MTWSNSSAYEGPSILMEEINLVKYYREWWRLGQIVLGDTLSAVLAHCCPIMLDFPFLSRARLQCDIFHFRMEAINSICEPNKTALRLE